MINASGNIILIIGINDATHFSNVVASTSKSLSNTIHNVKIAKII